MQIKLPIRPGAYLSVINPASKIQEETLNELTQILLLKNSTTDRTKTGHRIWNERETSTMIEKEPPHFVQESRG